MTDKELLEYAAKAAGYKVNKSPISGRMYISPGVSQWEEWNPLTDDAQALRLAVKLRFDVDVSDRNNKHTFVFNSKTFEVTIKVHNDDPYAATRRAIVRAAAEVGKAGESNEP